MQNIPSSHDLDSPAVECGVNVQLACLKELEQNSSSDTIIAKQTVAHEKRVVGALKHVEMERASKKNIRKNDKKTSFRFIIVYQSH